MPERVAADDGIYVELHGVPHWVEQAWLAQARRERLARMRAARPALSVELVAPRPQEQLAKPREQRPTRRRSGSSSRGSPDEPPLEAIPLSRFRRDVDRAVKTRALLWRPSDWDEIEETLR
jgi:hypothetical protein